MLGRITVILCPSWWEPTPRPHLVGVLREIEGAPGHRWILSDVIRPCVRLPSWQRWWRTPPVAPGHDFVVSTVYLVHGYLGVGKTRFARVLEEETGGIRFSIDEWYLRLYHGDEPTSHLDDELWSRLTSVLEDVWMAVAGRGVDVILDFGFWSRSARDRARSLAASLDAEVVLYSVLCDEAVGQAAVPGPQ